MPTVPTATLITDREHGPQLSDNINTISGVRYYRVNTTHESDALRAAGLPKLFDWWDPYNSNLLVVSRTTEYIGGTDDSITQIGGWTRVRVDYDVNASGMALPVVGSAYTAFDTRVTSQVLMKDVRGTETAAIENGRGTQVELGGALATVISFPAANDVYRRVDRIIQLQAKQNVNAQAMTLPRILATGYRPVVPARGARYHDFKIDVQRGIVRLSHVLILSPAAGSHFWFKLDNVGANISEPIEAYTHLEADFTGLW